MGAIQYLLEDKPGTVHLDVPRSCPSAATVTIKTSGNGDLPDTAVEDQAVTMDPYERTVTAWVASAPRTITVIAGAGTAVIGRQYLTRAADGKSETIKIVGLVVGVGGITDELEIADKLPYDLAVGDVVGSTRVTYDLTAEQLANRGLYRCIWTCTIGGVDKIFETLYRTVRSVPYNPGTAAGLRARHGDLTVKWDQSVRRDSSWAAYIAVAWDAVLRDIEGRKIVDGADGPIIDRIVDWSQAEETVYQRVLLDMAPTRRPSEDWISSDWVQHREAEYRRELNLWLNSIRWFDDSEADRVLADGESGKDKASIRMSR